MTNLEGEIEIRGTAHARDYSVPSGGAVLPGALHSSGVHRSGACKLRKTREMSPPRTYALCKYVSGNHTFYIRSQAELTQSLTKNCVQNYAI